MPGDYWRVNSYGYPNPLVDNSRAQEAWTTFLSFFAFNSYSGLKDYWGSGSADRILSSHAVESWKATFEEFGLLYVLSGSNEITVTPAGHQYRAAAEAGNTEDAGWIGLNLLCRYPLRGGRGSRGPRFDESDLFVYRALYSAIKDLDGYIWWSELLRVLSQAFTRDEVKHAVETIRTLRTNPGLLTEYPEPEGNQGTVYNYLNQVMVHAGLFGMVVEVQAETSPYPVPGTERRHWIAGEWSDAMDRLLLGEPAGTGESPTGAYLDHLAAAPDFGGDEVAYFAYMGAAVGDSGITSESTPTEPPEVGVGVSYETQDEAINTASIDPYEVDPDVRDRGTSAHALIQNSLAAYVESLGFDPLSPGAGDPLFDLAWHEDDVLFVAEVKSTTLTNEEKQLRLGLGQVLRYRHLLGASTEDVRAVLAVENEPQDPTWLELCEEVGVVLVWYGHFERLHEP